MKIGSWAGICPRLRYRRLAAANYSLPLYCTRLTVAWIRSTSEFFQAERMSGEMRLCWSILAVAVLLAMPVAGKAAGSVSCTTQAELSPADRSALSAAGGRLSQAVVQQDFSALQAALLPAEAAAWDGIREAVEATAPVMKGGQAQLRSVYLLDASSLTAPTDTQFFCSNSSATLTVTISMRALPPGRYAVVLADAAGSALGGQLGMILGWDNSGASPGWKLAGLSMRPGILDGHDGVWYWTHARELSKNGQPWSAWFCYEAARSLLVPVDYISSPNLEKLAQEQAQIKSSPQDAFPYSLPDGPRTWKIDTVHVDASLQHADLGVAYESVGVTDPAAVRTEATTVLSALLKAQPGLRDNFHGLWAYSVKDGKRTPVIELPMAQIP
jgi:hypothetical protein